MRRKTAIYISGLLVVCIMLIVGYFALWRDTNVTVYDDRFKIIDYCMSTGSTHTFYSGNQTIGRIKDTLRTTFGLKLKNTAQMTISGEECLVLFVRYTGDLPFKELDGLDAVLRSDALSFDQLKGLYDQDKQVFTRCFVTNKVPKISDSLRIDFYLSSEYDEPIATLRVGELKKHKK